MFTTRADAFRVSGSGFRILGFGFRVLGLGIREYALRVHRREDSEFRGFGFGIRDSSSGFRVPGFGFRVSGFGSMNPGADDRVPSFGFRLSAFGFRDLGVGTAGADAGRRRCSSIGLEKIRKPCLVANRATLPQKWPPSPPERGRFV